MTALGSCGHLWITLGGDAINGNKGLASDPKLQDYRAVAPGAGKHVA